MLLTAALAMLALPCDQALARRQTVLERTDKPAVTFVPPANSLDTYDAPVLSGLDYTAVAPPGVRLRVVEDEPYIHLIGPTDSRHDGDFHSHTALTLRSDQPAGWYEARVSLRVHPGKNPDNPLALSFDTAAYYAYTGNLLAPESRGETTYSLHEIRSPLGLTDIHDKDHHRREYLAYSATVVNPLNPVFFAESPNDPGSANGNTLSSATGDLASAIEAATTSLDSSGNTEVAGPPSGVLPPYQYTQGELKVMRRVTRAHVLLTIEFEATNHPHSLTMTENLARCIINRLEPDLPAKSRLGYLAYYPEYEPFVPYFEGEVPDERTADLAERPGEGCGADPKPITGDVCPQCGEGPHWPAQPYRDADYSCVLPAEAWPRCSHCLLLPHQERYRDIDQLRLLYKYGDCETRFGRDACGGCSRCSDDWNKACKNPCEVDCGSRECDSCCD